MDTDGRYIDQIAQIIRAPGEFDKARQALLSKTLDSIFLDMQVKRYAQLSATDQVFFAKLNKRYAAEFEEKADVSKINLEFLKLANQKATTEGDREARKLLYNILQLSSPLTKPQTEALINLLKSMEQPYDLGKRYWAISYHDHIMII